MIYKTLHKKLNIEQHGYYINREWTRVPIVYKKNCMNLVSIIVCYNINELSVIG